jgi:hypothetical protein
MTRKKKDYPKRGNNRPAAARSEEQFERPNLATINMDAAAGRPGLKVGDSVQIGGSGLYAGEQAVVERLSGGVIPSAVVRTASGQTRHVRTIDLTSVPESADK